MPVHRRDRSPDRRRVLGEAAEQRGLADAAGAVHVHDAPAAPQRRVEDGELLLPPHESPLPRSLQAPSENQIIPPMHEVTEAFPLCPSCRVTDD